MASISIKLRPYVDATGKQTVYVIYTHLSKKLQVNTGIKVSAGNLSSDKVVGLENADIYNEIIRLKVMQIEEARLNVLRTGEEPTVGRVRKMMLSEKRGKRTLLDDMKSYIEKQESLQKNVVNAGNVFAAIKRMEKNSGVFSYEDINHSWREIFVQKLLDGTITRSAKGVSNSTMKQYVTVFCSFMKWAEIREYHENGKYRTFVDSIRYRKSPKRKPVLTPDQVDKVNEVTLDSRKLRVARDMFVFGTQTGLRYSDLCKLTWSDIKEKDGKRYVSFVAEKTNRSVVVWLDIIGDLAAQVLQRRKEKHRDLIFYQAPTRFVVNDYVRKIGQRAGLDSSFKTVEARGAKQVQKVGVLWQFLTSHVARHTFASNFMVKNGNIRVLKDILGHASVQQTEKYVTELDGQRLIRQSHSLADA